MESGYMSPRKSPQKPTELKIGHAVYSVVYDTVELNAAIRDHQEQLYGLTRPDQHKIIIDPDVSWYRLIETLMHEILHACWDLTNLAVHYKDEQEEEIVRSLSPILVSLLQQNPIFVEAITWQLKQQ
jgi:hypothetical protein